MSKSSVIEWRVEDDHSGLVVIDGRPVARYHYSDQSNHPYFDQVTPRNHSGVLVNHAPSDHPWHHGLWWSWKLINGTLYWEDREGFGGDALGLGRARVSGHQVENTDAGLRIAEEVEWVDHHGAVVLAEQRILTISADQGSEDRWSIDWDMTWRALTEARFTVTPYPENSWGGYAGLNYRPSRAMADREQILADQGRSGVAKIHGEQVRWAAYTGDVDDAGIGDPSDPAHGGIALLSHPGNPSPTNPCYTYSATGGFGFLAAAPLMHEEKTLAQDEELCLRFRTTVLGRTTSADELEVLAQGYGN